MSGRALVLGAGPDELVAAQVLARAGWQVLVLDERSPQKLDERSPQNRGAPTVGWVAPAIVRAFDLERHGLQTLRPDPWLTLPVDGAAPLELSRDIGRSVESIRRFSSADASRWPEFCERIAAVTRALESLAGAAPPDPLAGGAAGIVELAGAALGLRRPGRRSMEDLLRFLPMPIADLLDDWFESHALKAALGVAGVSHLRQGPRSGGTTLNFLHQHLGCPAGVFRLLRSNLEETLARLPGIEIRNAVRVSRIAVSAQKVSGVVLASGEEIAARMVLCGADPGRTLLELVEPGWLEPELVRALRGIRSRGAVAQAVLELDRPAGFTRIAVAESLDQLEQAYDDAKYGRVSRRPLVEAVADGNSVRIDVQYVPYELSQGSWDRAQRERLLDTAVRMLEAPVPGLASAIRERSVLAPPDLEARFGWPQGQRHQAEFALDQWLWMRPVPELARYRTPIGGLYLCGAAMHPGAWAPGACGYHAARQVLKEWRNEPEPG